MGSAQMNTNERRIQEMKSSILTALAVATSLILAPYAFTAEEAGQLSAVNLLTLEDLKGMEIHTPQGKKLGSVDQLFIDIEEGQLAYVVVSHGGFVRKGTRTAIIPWNAFVVPSPMAQDDDRVLVLHIERGQFRNAPHGNLETVLDREQGMEIHNYYGVSPYWESE
jgi:sporulation protein YlmC with PRC-barrel domain